MNATTSPSTVAAVNTERVNEPLNAMAAAWEHLDAICVGDDAQDGQESNMVSLAADTVGRVKAALLSGQPLDRAALALLLDAVAWQLHQVGVHLEEVVWSLGEAVMA